MGSGITGLPWGETLGPYPMLWWGYLPSQQVGAGVHKEVFLREIGRTRGSGRREKRVNCLRVLNGAVFGMVGRIGRVGLAKYEANQRKTEKNGAFIFVRMLDEIMDRLNILG